VVDGQNGNLEEPVKFLKANQGYTGWEKWNDINGYRI
jgi:hypothetical protein